MIRLAELTSPAASRLARDRRAVVLLPLGAVEQHGPHLPLLVDWLGAEELARRIAPHLRRAGFRPVLAPSLAYGVSTLALGWPGTVSLSVGTLRRLVVEVVGQLAAHGHLKAIAAARRELRRRRRGLTVLVAGFAPGSRRRSAMRDPRVTALQRSPRPEAEWHAGELETSLVLALARRDAAARAVDRPRARARARRAAPSLTLTARRVKLHVVRPARLRSQPASPGVRITLRRR